MSTVLDIIFKISWIFMINFLKTHLI
jgi:hypothetical protein